MFSNLLYEIRYSDTAVKLSRLPVLKSTLDSFCEIFENPEWLCLFSIVNIIGGNKLIIYWCSQSYLVQYIYITVIARLVSGKIAIIEYFL